MYENFPFTKTFIYRINADEWYIEFEYKQATAMESIEFYNKWLEEQLKEIANIIECWVFHWYNKTNKRYKTKKMNTYKVRSTKESILNKYIKKEWDKLINKITDTKHSVYKSIYEGIPKPIGKRNKSIFWYDLMFICSEYNIPWPKHLLENYTLEQVGYLWDWLTFKSYESDKKTQWINDRALFIKKWWLDHKQKALLKKLKEQRAKDLKKDLKKDLENKKN